MFRPSLRPRPFGLRVLATLAAGLSIGLTSPVHAVELDDGEALIGTFDLRPSEGGVRVGNPPAGRGWHDAGPASNRSPAGDAQIETLYHNAMDDLAAGERASAQRLFEQLIARAPDSDYASRARRQLAELYNSPDMGHVTSKATVRSPVASDERSGSSRQSNSIATSTARWISPDTEMQFILDAGDRVFFSAGTADLGARARGVLALQARWLKQNPDLAIEVEGYADDLPLDEQQQAALAASRAEAVRQRLIAEGVEPERITTASFGREQRLSDCDRPECAAQNRRVVTLLSDRGASRDSQSQQRPVQTRPMAAGNPVIQGR